LIREKIAIFVILKLFDINFPFVIWASTGAKYTSSKIQAVGIYPIAIGLRALSRLFVLIDLLSLPFYHEPIRRFSKTVVN